PIAYVALRQLIALKYPPLNIELFGLNAFLLSILVPVAVTKIYFNSISKGIMIFALNFALSFVRLKAAIAALLNKSPIIGWIKGDMHDVSGNLVLALKSARTELAFSIVIFASSVLAFLSYNFSGAMWLVWYGILYSSTFFFFYKYG
ncbi:MAG: hypothetical protein QXT43_00970, partial [Candidatus Micrarchaeaceae archaeon]